MQGWDIGPYFGTISGTWNASSRTGSHGGGRVSWDVLQCLQFLLTWIQSAITRLNTQELADMPTIRCSLRWYLSNTCVSLWCLKCLAKASYLILHTSPIICIPLMSYIGSHLSLTYMLWKKDTTLVNPKSSMAHAISGKMGCRFRPYVRWSPEEVSKSLGLLGFERGYHLALGV